MLLIHCHVNVIWFLSSDARSIHSYVNSETLDDNSNDNDDIDNENIVI